MAKTILLLIILQVVCVLSSVTPTSLAEPANDSVIVRLAVAIGIEQDFEDFSVGYDGMHAYRARHGG